MRISDWSSDVCSSDLLVQQELPQVGIVVDDQHKLALAWRGVVAVLLARRRFGGRPRIGEVQTNCRAPPAFARSEERRGGKECDRTCRSRWWPDRSKNNTEKDIK